MWSTFSPHRNTNNLSAWDENQTADSRLVLQIRISYDYFRYLDRTVVRYNELSGVNLFLVLDDICYILIPFT